MLNQNGWKNDGIFTKFALLSHDDHANCYGFKAIINLYNKINTFSFTRLLILGDENLLSSTHNTTFV
jgi:hypothetical protein